MLCILRSYTAAYVNSINVNCVQFIKYQSMNPHLNTLYGLVRIVMQRYQLILQRALYIVIVSRCCCCWTYFYTVPERERILYSLIDAIIAIKLLLYTTHKFTKCCTHNRAYSMLLLKVLSS